MRWSARPRIRPAEGREGLQRVPTTLVAQQLRRRADRHRIEALMRKELAA
jgi:hypothetical protein